MTRIDVHICVRWYCKRNCHASLIDIPRLDDYNIDDQCHITELLLHQGHLILAERQWIFLCGQVGPNFKMQV